MPADWGSLRLDVHPRSRVAHGGVDYALAHAAGGPQLAVLAPAGAAALEALEGERSELAGQTLLLGPLSPHNAAALRDLLPWLRPCPWGLRTSVGMGDRVGLATPGHVRALRSAGGKPAPVFAQQSIREMTRTDRTPQEVLDDATWGVFAEGWQGGVGADADHLKTTADIDACLQAGYTLFTIDPGNYVDNRATSASLSQLRQMAEELPPDLQPRASGLLNKEFNLEGRRLCLDELTLTRASVKYGRAVAHVAAMQQHLAQAAGRRPHELEVSVDETEQPTTHAEHLYLASELKRLGVQWVSLAPRFVGRFEKGVDYISPSGVSGEVTDLEADLAGHAAVARLLGPYKLSLHSGSDKFSIYPLAMRQTRGLVHLKTAGTSYLEALRTIAALDADLLRRIYVFARQRYPIDRASYQISAELERAPLPEAVIDWPALLEQFDARQILHVTFGSVLTEQTPGGEKHFYDPLVRLLRANPEVYASNLEAHLLRHLRPLSEGPAETPARE